METAANELCLKEMPLKNSYSGAGYSEKSDPCSAFSDVVQLTKQKKRGGKKGAGRANGREVMLSNAT